MTRKHYEAIAKAIKSELDYHTSHYSQGESALVLRNAAKHISDNLELLESNFDRDRFLRACGLED